MKVSKYGYKAGKFNEWNILNDYHCLYILRGDKYFYVGESANVRERMKEHARTKKEDKYNFHTAYIVTDDDSNETVMKLCERLLIMLMRFEKKNVLTNIQKGDKYTFCKNMQEFELKFDKLCFILEKEKIIKAKRFNNVMNIFLLQKNPFRVLNDEQKKTLSSVVRVLESKGTKPADRNYKSRPIFISGGPGTGKTFLAIAFFDYLKNLNDLVLIMDESHHYRAAKSANAINDLNPLLGIELTATPQVQDGNKTILFKNVVYEYPLSQAIKDGYTRTPYALTRKDINKYDFSDDELDKVMINDGINHHERIKMALKNYSKVNNMPLVKPFMLIVCKDTKHAVVIESYIKSESFKEGYYKDKVISVHSNQKGEEKDDNVRLLLDVEKTSNKVEIVIHVNMLKEGWDVNNLYTIVPLRTAASKTLREQTIGRGLRLPYGFRTGDKDVDSVTITAHDKFEEIINEAMSDESIFKKGGIIYAEDESKLKFVESNINPTLFDDSTNDEKILTASGLNPNSVDSKQMLSYIKQKVAEIAANDGLSGTVSEQGKKVIEKVKKDIEKDTDFAQRYNANTVRQVIDNFHQFNETDKIVEKVNNFSIYVPKTSVSSKGDEKYIIEDFNLDFTDLKYQCISNEILMKDLIKGNTFTIGTDTIDFDTIKPEKLLVDLIRARAEIDYEKAPEQIQKAVQQQATPKPVPKPEAKPEPPAPKAPQAAKPAPPTARPSIKPPTTPKPVAKPSSAFQVPVPSGGTKSGTYATGPISGSGTANKGGSTGGSPASSGSGGGKYTPAPSLAPTGGGSSSGQKLARGGGGGTGGLGNPGPGNPNGRPGIDTIREPDFGPYMRELQRRIKMNWDPPKGNESKRVVLLFKIAKDGRLLSCSVYKSSGLKSADDAALNAVRLTAPFKPLPPDYKGQSIDIQFTFDYNVFGASGYQ